MEFGEQDLQRIIRLNPGDYAVYELQNGTLRTLYASPELPGHSGMTAEEYRQLTCEDALNLVVENDLPYVRARLAEAAGGNQRDFDDTYRVKHKARGFVWIHARVRLIGQIGGCPVLLAVFQNSSSESAEYALLLDRLKSKVYVVEKGSYELLYANQFALQSWGHGNYSGRTCYNYIAGRSEPCPWCAIPEARGGCAHQEEVYSPAADRWYRIDGNEMNWFGRQAFAFFSLDITDQKMQQQSLEIDKMDLEKIIGNVPVGVAVCEVRDGDYTPVAMNPYIYELLDISPDEFCADDRSMLDFIHPDDREPCIAFMHELRQPNAFFGSTFRYCRNPERGWRYLRVEARTLQQADGVMSFAGLTDISAEKEAEASMRKSRQIYESAVETAELSVWEYDIRRRCIHLSENGSTVSDSEKFGIPKEIENAPDTVLQWIDPKDAEKVKALYKRLEEGVPYIDCEYWYRPSPGKEPRCEHIAYTTVFDENGHPLTAYGIGQNVTAQKREEEKYSRLYRQLVEANPKSIGTFRQNLTKDWCGDGQSPYPTVLTQQDSHTVDGYFAAAAERVTDPAIKKEFLRLFNREHLLAAFREGQTQLSLAYPVLFNTGEAHWVNGYLNMIQNPTTGDVESVTYAYDITDRKKDEDVIRCITDEKCDYIGLIDTEQKTFEFRNINREIEGLPLRRRIDYSTCVRYDIEHFVAPEDVEKFRNNTTLANLREKLGGETEYTFIYTHMVEKQKLRKQLQYSYLDRSRREILIVQTDVTDAYEQEQAQLRNMEAALRSAEDANRAKSEFLTRISHDIRTPMNVINGMTEFAFEDINDREKLQDDLEKIRNANTFLTSLINDILDISKIDSGKIELHPEPCSCEKFIAAVSSVFGPLCREKGITFIVEQKHEPVPILVDLPRINQIALNLLSNAVKFTPPGGTVTCIAEGKRCGDKMVDCSFEVRDTGVGMSESFQKVMYVPFTQEQTTTGRLLNENGTGLGLSIVERLVQLMGGTIEVNSEPGKGTSVKTSFRFPEAEREKQTPDAAEGRQSAAKPLRGRVLVAEDHPINTEIASRLLENFGLEVTAAENGARAVELFENARPGEYCAILMDVQMPVMDGYAATKTIRAMDRPDSGTIPIIAMTGDAYAEDVQRALESGMNAHVSKPLDPKLLRATLAGLLK